MESLTKEQKEIRKAFELQRTKILPLTQEELYKLKAKTYRNGTKKEVGDIVYYAFIRKEDTLELISINSIDIDDYVVDKVKISVTTSQGANKLFPIIKEKEKTNG